MKTTRKGLSKVIAMGLLGSTLAGIGVAAMAAPSDADDVAKPKAAVSGRTGTRIADPATQPVATVIVFDRDELDASGATTLGDFLRRTSLNSFGAIRPQSASTLQPLSAANLRGLVRIAPLSSSMAAASRYPRSSDPCRVRTSTRSRSRQSSASRYCRTAHRHYMAPMPWAA